MKKLFSVIFLFSLLYTLFALRSPRPVLAKYATGVCCDLGQPEQCGEGNYVCDTAVDFSCQGRGECFLIGPYDEFLETIKECDEKGALYKECFDMEGVKNLMLTASVGLGEGTGGGGAIGMIGNLIAALYSVQPASSVEYLADISRNIGLASPIYAQGLGWTAFSPVLSLWKTFRNISYLAFVIIFVVIGFMIMFRAKVDPQTVISIQNALPRIIATLILISFSYAIAGLIIDLSQLSTRMIASILKNEGLIAVTGSNIQREETLQKLLNANIFELVNPLRDIDLFLQHLSSAEIPIVSGISSIPILNQLTVGLIFRIAVFFIMFKIFFALIGPYISIILSVIFAPFQILIGALPGSSGGFSGWLKQLAANVLVFPVTFTMLAIAAVFKGYTRQAWILRSANWDIAPGKYSVQWFPVTIGNWGEVAGDLICFGILFTIPKVVEMVQSALQIKPAPWAGAAAQEIKAGIGRIPLVGGFLARQV